MALTGWSSTIPACVKGVWTTANESAPTGTDGLDLCPASLGGKRLKGFSVTAEADSTKTLSGSGSLQAYVYDPAAAAWSRCPDLDLSVTASGIQRQSFSGFELFAGPPGSRLAFVPVGVGVSAGGLTVYLNGDLP